jgi:membrane dipeptidase
MVKLFLSIAVLLLVGCSNYKKIHRDAIVIDTHNDVISTVSMRGMNIDLDLAPRTHSDTKRFLQSGIDVQVFAIFSDERFGKDTAFKYANIEIDTLESIVRRNADKMRMVYNPADLDAVVKNGLFGCMMGLEGGHMIEDRIENLDSLYKRGVRYMTLTWNNSTSWASSAWDETKNTIAKKGLSDLGKQIVRRMNELGMIVDVSHVGEQTFWDVIATTRKPIIASHSCAHALCPVPRNLKDDQIKAIGKNGGVIHLNFYSGFIDSNYNARLAIFNKAHQAEKDSLKNLKMAEWEIEEWLNKEYPKEAEHLRPPLSFMLDHIDHIVRLIGVDHVGIGSDFDGISSSPRGLDDVTDMPQLTKALLKRGYSKSDVRKILGENFIRVFRANASR